MNFNFAIGLGSGVLLMALLTLGSLAADRPTDQQLDQVVQAIQGLATHREPVVRGREILKGALYRWGNQ
jgi:hypothetical protein